MGKKTSLYSRKRRPGHTFNGAEWINTIQRAQVYGSLLPMPGFGSNRQTADEAEILVRDALVSLLDHVRPLDPERAFDLLSHAIGASAMRALQIEPCETRNPALPILKAGSAALLRAIERHEKADTWGLDGAGRQPLVDAINLYADILRTSSPAQMARATEERLRVLARHRSAHP